MHPVFSPSSLYRARILLFWLLFAVGAALYASLDMDDPFALEGGRVVELEQQRDGASGDGMPPLSFSLIELLRPAVVVDPPLAGRAPLIAPRPMLLGAVTRAPPAGRC